jgi:predicted DNA-binding transcriptional regulator AlpA
MDESEPRKGESLLNTKQVSELTGFSPKRIRHYILSECIPYVRVHPTTILFREDEIRDWLKHNKQDHAQRQEDGEK